ncbi:DUF6301 family protein [Nocardia salmonicida]|uniref:DUF6301 family protein n=1 Tax=Nocardia salmonicida TaxID=53431 RepID=UPI00340F57F7
MHVEIEGAARVARIAAGFDWSWTIDDLESFCAEVGWELAERRPLGATIQTDFDISVPTARVYAPNRWMDYISARISDFLDDDIDVSSVHPLLVDGFERAIAELDLVLGTPTRLEPGYEPVALWYLPNVVVSLSFTAVGIQLATKRPGYQAFIDESDPEREE